MSDGVVPHGMVRALADLMAAIPHHQAELRELRDNRIATRWSAYLMKEIGELATEMFDFEKSRWSVDQTMLAIARCRARLLHIAVVALGGMEWLDSGSYLPRT